MWTGPVDTVEYGEDIELLSPAEMMRVQGSTTENEVISVRACLGLFREFVRTYLEEGHNPYELESAEDIKNSAIWRINRIVNNPAYQINKTAFINRAIGVIQEIHTPLLEKLRPDFVEEIIYGALHDLSVMRDNPAQSTTAPAHEPTPV